MLESSIFINDGGGSFKKKIMPAEAQFSPVRSILFSDIDNDGSGDLILSGNDYNIRPSYGRYDASYGLLLLSDKTQEFHPQSLSSSGLVIKGDARKSVLIKGARNKYLLSVVNSGRLQILRLK